MSMQQVQGLPIANIKMIQIKILDNHKIPRKYRDKDNKFYAIDIKGEKPECDGADWRSKNVYIEVVVSKRDLRKKQYYSLPDEDRRLKFTILKTLTVKAIYH